MEKWEYKTIKVDSKGSKNGTLDIGDLNMTLNQLGNIGWELVSCFPVAHGQGSVQEMMAVFKRKPQSGSGDFESEESPRYPAKKPRPFREEARSYGKSSGYKGKNFESEGNGPGYKGKGPGKTGKSVGQYGEKPKSFGEPRSYGRSSGSGYKGKSKGRS